jgi:hypothetical protein
MLEGFLHICTCTCTIYCGLWLSDNTSCIFITWYQSPGLGLIFLDAQLVRGFSTFLPAAAANLWFRPRRPLWESAPLAVLGRPFGFDPPGIGWRMPPHQPDLQQEAVSSGGCLVGRLWIPVSPSPHQLPRPHVSGSPTASTCSICACSACSSPRDPVARTRSRSVPADARSRPPAWIGRPPPDLGCSFWSGRPRPHLSRRPLRPDLVSLVGLSGRSPLDHHRPVPF